MTGPDGTGQPEVLFVEKVRRPAARGLVRERIGQRLVGPDAPATGLVVGAAGSGKTTVLAHLAAAAVGPVAWFRVGEEDTTEAAVALHLGHALAVSLAEPSLAIAGARGSVRALVTELDQVVHGRPAAAAAGAVLGMLVVDDLHAVAATPAERALGIFLAARPTALRVLLGSRRTPDLNTSRMLVSGELVLVDGDDLRFRSWEVEELYATVYRTQLSPESVAALTRRTAGWAAGLQLFRLATSDRTRAEQERAVEQLTGRSRLVRSYLTRNVLAGLSPTRLDFLVRTSTLGVLTANLCDLLLDRHDSAAALAELDQAQLFTTSTDDGRTYRYHHVLQTHLEVQLVDHVGAQAARATFRQAGALLEADDRLGPALNAYVRGEDFGAVARLLRHVEVPLPEDETWWGALALPGAPTDDPGLALAGARLLAHDGQLERAGAAFQHAEGLMDDPWFVDRCRAGQAAVRAWLPGGCPPRLDTAGLGELAELWALGRSTAAARTSPSPLVRGLGLLLDGEAGAALPPLRLAVADEVSAAPWRAVVASLATQVALVLQQGRPVPADQLEMVVDAADAAGLRWLSRLARGWQTAVLLLKEPSDWRLSASRELVEELSWRDERWTLCLVELGLAAALLHVDRGREAQPLIDQAATIAAQLSAPVLASWVERVGGVGNRAGAATRAEYATTAPSPTTARGTVPPVGHPPARLAMLGGFELQIRRHGVDAAERLDVTALRPRPRQLLMLLAVHHGRQVHRERLVDLLWPDATSLAAGVRSLQVAISHVRQHLVAAGLGEAALLRTGDAYALRVPGLVDLTADFDKAATAVLSGVGSGVADGDLLDRQLDALAAYTGDLLPEVGPAEWVLAERDRLGWQAATVAAAAAATALACRRSADGIRAGRRAVELDPYHDPSWTVLAELHEQAGDRTGAEVVRAEHLEVCAALGLPAGERPARSGPAAPAQPVPGRRVRPVDPRGPRPRSRSALSR